MQPNSPKQNLFSRNAPVQIDFSLWMLKSKKENIKESISKLRFSPTSGFFSLLGSTHLTDSIDIWFGHIHQELAEQC